MLCLQAASGSRNRAPAHLDSAALYTGGSQSSDAAGSSADGVSASIASLAGGCEVLQSRPAPDHKSIPTAEHDSMESNEEPLQNCHDNSSSSKSCGNGNVGGDAANGTKQQAYMVALDCEMCYCGPDNLEVTRLSLVGSRGEVSGFRPIRKHTYWMFLN